MCGDKMTKLEAQKTLEKMKKAGNAYAKIVMVGCDSKGIKYAIKTGYGKYIK